MKTRTLALLIPLALGACEDGGGSGGLAQDTTGGADTVSGDTTVEADTNAPADTSVAPDTNAPQPDTTPTGETSLPAGCDYTGFNSVATELAKESGSLVLAMQSATNAPLDVLQIEIYTFGDYQGATDVGTYPLDGSDYASCANCVLVRANCSDGTCEKRFLVDEGDLIITQWDFAGGLFKGQLGGGARAHEVTIDTETFESTLVPGGGTWCLDGVAFEAEIPTLPVSTKAQPNCVADGTGNLVGDNVANFSLTNCNGRRVKLHGTCGDPEQKALWLIGTTGWCTACHEFLEDFVSKHGGSLSRAKVGEVSRGLDMLILLGEDNYGNKPTEAYCKAYAEDLRIDPEMVLIDWVDEGVPVNVVNAPGVQVELNGLGTVWTAMDPYLYEEGGSIATYYPWWALLRPFNMEYVWSDRAALQSWEVTLLGLLAE